LPVFRCGRGLRGQAAGTPQPHGIEARTSLRFAACIQGQGVQQAAAAQPEALLAMLEGCDAFRRPVRLEELLFSCEAEAFGARGWVEAPYPPRLALARALAAAAGLDAGAVAAASERAQIAANVRAARLAAVEATIGRRG